MEWVNDLSPAWAHFLLFFTLYISGAGVPIPEELPLAAGGFLVAQGVISFPAAAACIAAALILGDLTAYWLGRRFGMRLFQFAPFRWLLNPDRLELVKCRFQEHEGKAIFIGRHLAGLRLVTFVFAGMVRVNVVKFVVIDFLAACISAPIPVFLAYYFGDIDRARAVAKKVDMVLIAVVAVALIVGWLIWRFRRRSACSPADGSAPQQQIGDAHDGAKEKIS